MDLKLCFRIVFCAAAASGCVEDTNFLNPRDYLNIVTKDAAVGDASTTEAGKGGGGGGKGGADDVDASIGGLIMKDGSTGNPDIDSGGNPANPMDSSMPDTSVPSAPDTSVPDMPDTSVPDMPDTAVPDDDSGA